MALSPSKTGIEFKNTLVSSPNLNILNYLYFYNGGGVALADFNKDGLLDIYFTSNQQADKLYVNKGNLTFKDITEISGINNSDGWTTGVTTVDINADGLMDIYISKMSGHQEIKGKNLLYLNEGSKNGIPYFTESAAKYHLDISALTTQTSFFDADQDGDLDAYLLTHSVHPNAQYTKGAFRYLRNPEKGDKLLRNEKGVFIDISETMNILQNPISFGLGIAAGDLNNDGYTDLYIGNDFFENDYLYIHDKDSSYMELNAKKSILGHSSRFSMGNDLADINNDGTIDLISMDMLPENLETLKSAGQEYSYPIFQSQLKYGYEPQFMQNTLHINNGNLSFSESAFLQGIAATEWSWAPLLADFDHDGYKDLYITNGILGATNDLDFVNFISNEAIQKKLGTGMTPEDLELIKKLPTKKTANYFFKNNKGKNFVNTTDTWFQKIPSYSNGGAYGDLDNDGDIDLVINNINSHAFILENLTNTQKDKNHFIKINFKGEDKNTFGIGAKVEIYTQNNCQFFENYTTRGYLSAVPPQIVAGVAKNTLIDSIRVIWPTGKYQVLSSLPVDTTLTLQEINAFGSFYSELKNKKQPLLSQITPLIPYKHIDGISIEFSRSPLTPFASTNEGVCTVVGDINSDTLEDILSLGAKGQPTTYWLQTTEGAFEEKKLEQSNHANLNEDIDAVIFDANNDGHNDILIVSAGNEFKTGNYLQPRLYLGSQGTLQRSDAFQGVFINASSVTTVDIDNDNDLDICITANVVPHEFGATPSQYVFSNDGKGNFTNCTATFASALENLGNITTIVWMDLDNNGFKDAIVTGHWMPITLLLNDGKKLTVQNNPSLKNTNGLWNTLKVADFDNDGDQDIMAGNWGLNSRLTASPTKPLQLYLEDFDNNQKIDPVLTYFYHGKETPLATKDELVKQLPFINKKFLSYNAFSKASMDELFGRKKIAHAPVKKVFELGSCYFENKGNYEFEKHLLPGLSQVSSVKDILVEDFNQDHLLDALLVGNSFEVSTQIGRLDASNGVLLLQEKQGLFKEKQHPSFQLNGACRSIKKLMIRKENYYVVGRNNDTPLFLKKEK